MAELYLLECFDDQTRFRLGGNDIGLALGLGSHVVIAERCGSAPPTILERGFHTGRCFLRMLVTKVFGLTEFISSRRSTGCCSAINARIVCGQLVDPQSI